MIIKGRVLNTGFAEGEAIVTKTPFSFKGEIDPRSGIVPSPSHELFGRSLKGKVLVCPTGKGSSENSNVAYEAKANGVMPAAIIVKKIEPVMAAAILISGIPALEVNEDVFGVIKSGDHVKVDGSRGIAEIAKRTDSTG